MRFKILVSVWLLVTFCLAAGTVGALSPEEVAKKLDPSVVRIFVVGPVQKGSGTGFVINREGYVATNLHVVWPHVRSGWQMYIADGGVDPDHRRKATLVKAFPGEDIAILRVSGLDRPAVMFADPDDDWPAKGATVFAIGFPGAADRLGPVAVASFTPGTVSRLFPGSWSKDAPTIRIIQHTAPTNPGNSGGPLVDQCGHVIGLNTQREARIVPGPGGFPVTDPIQGVFYSSHSSILMQKLESLGIRFRKTSERCEAVIAGASRNLSIYIVVAVLLALASMVFTVIFKPRPVVQVVVRCGKAVDDCVKAIDKAIKKLRS